MKPFIIIILWYSLHITQWLKMIDINTLQLVPFIWVVRDYIHRAFKQCQDEKDKDQVEKFLKDTLSKKFQDSTAWTTNWDVEPLPL